MPFITEKSYLVFPHRRSEFSVCQITCRPAVGPTELRIKRVLGASTYWRKWRVGVKLIAHHHVPRKLRMPEAIHPVHSYVFMAFTKTTSTFTKGKYCIFLSRSLWPCGLNSGSVGAPLLGLRVRIPSGAWMFVFCVLYRQRSLRPADTSSRGVVPSAYVSLRVIKCKCKLLHLQILDRRTEIKNYFLWNLLIYNKYRFFSSNWHRLCIM
jgi:hypothetical protein